MAKNWNWLNDAELLQLSTTSRRRTREAAYCCVHCSKSYCQKQHLRRHQLYECGREPMFQCPYCPKRCKQKIHVQSHIRRKHEKLGENMMVPGTGGVVLFSRCTNLRVPQVRKSLQEEADIDEASNVRVWPRASLLVRDLRPALQAEDTPEVACSASP
ncbi:hypothetical protein J6590_002377 [Homalodisca vitripennis]|nr:hypothetical protein J6590_002377 [Homalodisca vitripennis]